MKENERTAHQKLGGAAQSQHSRSAHMKKEERSQINNPLFYLNKPEKGKLNPKQVEEEIIKIIDEQNRE